MKPKIQRHEHILTLIREHNFMTVEELAANLDVTPQTIRRDVQELSETGQLKRYHGGAYRLHGHHRFRRGPPVGWRYYRRGDRRFHQPIQS